MPLRYPSGGNVCSARAMRAQQLRLDLRSSADHYDMIAGAQQRDLIAWTPAQQRHWHALNLEVARDKLSAWTNEPDIYITPNEFKSWRLIRLGDGLNALYVDIDAHGEVQPDFARMASVAVDKIERAGVPSPNFIVYTGRGVHLYWLIDRIPFQALPRWQYCQRRLVIITGADRNCTDSTRVLRVIGTVNSKTKTLVSAEMLTPQRYNFDWLADQIAELPRAEIRDLRAARAKRQAKPSSKTGTIYDRWWLVYQDLITICDHHWFGGVASGSRDRLLFLMATALSWFTHSDALENEILMTARRFMPTLSLAEARGYCSSVIARAKHDAEHPDAYEWGKGRYRFKRETLMAELSDLVTPDLLPRLRAIVPAEIIRERKTSREKTRKRAAGEVKQSREGYLATAADKRASAHRLRSEGKSTRQIAKELNISVGAVSGYLKVSNQGVQSPCPCIVGEAHPVFGGVLN